MAHDTGEILSSLLAGISAMEEVQSIGISGSITPLPKAGEGDIDIFIYCTEVPVSGKRQCVIEQLGSLLEETRFSVFEKGHWGIGDFGFINGVETWLMYFSVDETLEDVKSILSGELPDRLDKYYYPIGRCAMLRTINVLYDKNGFLHSLKERLSEYPDELSCKLVKYHLDGLDDTEDLERAVGRKDVLFYHFAVDIAIDHFLQALFAVNKIYFPSRKRTLDYIEKFPIKPERCGERLMEVIRLGGCPDTTNRSYELWCSLVDELRKIAAFKE